MEHLGEIGSHAEIFVINADAEAGAGNELVLQFAGQGVVA
jgi:hypothetical protein